MSNVDFGYLKAHTTYSLRKSVIKPDDLIKTAKGFGATSLAITEFGNLFSSVDIFTKCKKAGIKPIMGCNLYIKDKDAQKPLSNLTILAKNEKGWKDLLKVTATSNSHDNFHHEKEVATIGLDELSSLSSGNFIVYCGNLFSWIIPNLTTDYQQFLKASTYAEAKGFINADWKKLIADSLALLGERFGRENIRLEGQKVDIGQIPGADISNRIIEWAAKVHKIPLIATCRPHYLNKISAEDLKILICVDKKTTLKRIQEVLAHNFDPEYFPFFKNDNASLLSQDEFKALYTQEQLENNAQVVSAIADYDICGKPKLPTFICPNGIAPNFFLRKLCEDKLSTMNLGLKQGIYKDRLNFELGVLEEANLTSYILIVWDMIRYCQINNWAASSRGSVGGSLVAFLTNISDANPIKYNLIFERFYNKGRAAGGICDIDCDIMPEHRKDVADYVRDKYGRNHTASICTFGGLKGSGALREVLRTKSRCSVPEMNEMSKMIIKEDKISDELEELRQLGEDPSIIGWSLDNVKDLRQFAYYDDNGEIQGEYADDFKQAIRIEGCKRTLSRHACGLIVSSEPISNYCPMVYDKKDDCLMSGLDKYSCEAVGAPKYDLLGVAALSDIKECERLINEGDLI